ncbi:MAG: fused MFS/spermidine synthase [Nitrospinaceae bacterium]
MTLYVKSILYGLIFLSGFSGLVYEIIWLRVFSQVFGNTIQSASVVLAAFFFGLSLGSHFFGKKSGLTANPLRFFAYLELGIFVTALPLFFFQEAFEFVFPILYQRFHESSQVFTLVKIGIGFLVITGPSFFMGGTLPVIASFLVDRPQRITSTGGILYGINTLGGVLGSVGAGMLLPPLVGIRHTFYLAAAVNGMNFLIAFFLSRPEKISASLPGTVAGSAPHPTGERPVSFPEARSFKIYVIAAGFLSGFGLLNLEVLWNRMFSLVFQNSVYTFTAIVVVFLFALSLGSFLIAALDRVNWDKRNLLILLLILTGAASYTTPFIFVQWTGLSFLSYDPGWTGYIANAFLLVTGIILLPAVVGGMILPLLWKLFESPGVGTRIGEMNAVNTLGTITGSLAAGFLAVPLLGLWNSVALVSVFYLLLADMGLRFLHYSGFRRKMKIAVYALLLCIMVTHPAKLPVQKLNPNEYLAFLKEGSQATVAVIDKVGSRILKVNNHYTLGGINPILIEEMQGQLPLLLHNGPESAAFIGLATGITAGAAVPFSLKEIHIAEIVPEVAEAAKLFEKFNHHLLGQSNVRVHVEDGRNFMMGTGLRFDVVVADLFVPNHSGTGYLYSRNHFANIKRKLKPGGVFCQWLPAYELSPQDFQIIAATFRSVFPVNSVWLGDFSLKRPLVAFVGFQSPNTLSLESLSRRLAAFRELHPDDASTMFEISNLMLLYKGSLEGDETLKQTAINTGRNLSIEFSAPIHIANRDTLTGARMFQYLVRLGKGSGRAHSIFRENDPGINDYSQAGLELLQAIEAKSKEDTREMVRHILEARKLAPQSNHLKNLYNEIKRQLANNDP